MKILITGINGFVGKVLKRTLTGKGYSVCGIELVSGDKNDYSADITDFEKIEKILTEVSPDYVIHLAAITKITHDKPLSLYDVNINGTLSLLNSFKCLKKKPGFLFVSSSQVYGAVNGEPVELDESAPVDPMNHYGASKASGESLCRAYWREEGIPFVIARPFNHFGAGQKEFFVVPKIMKAFKEKRDVIELGDITRVRDFLDVRDVVNAYVRIIEDFRCGETYNIASGTGIDLSVIIDTASGLTGHNPEIRFNDSFLRHNEVKVQVGDSSKIKKHLGWSPVYSLEDTLKWMLKEMDA